MENGGKTGKIVRPSIDVRRSTCVRECMVRLHLLKDSHAAAGCPTEGAFIIIYVVSTGNRVAGSSLSVTCPGWL